MQSDYPTWVCTPCGLRYGNRKDYDGFTATFHFGTCGICGRKIIVTEPRDFGGLKPEWKKHKGVERAE